VARVAQIFCVKVPRGWGMYIERYFHRATKRHSRHSEREIEKENL
jgi:hypothetical protein